MASSSSSSSISNVPKRIAITRRKIAEPAASKNPKKRRITKTAATCSCLPDELWETIFKSLNGDQLTLKSLSVVSKQFLSITNRFQSSLKITDEAIPYLPRLFHRFPNLTSVDLTRLSQGRDLGAILTQISTFPVDLHALSCNSFAANGLLALSKTMKNLTSFSFCDGVGIARLLNATLVLPKFEVASYWNETSGFADVYNLDYFIQHMNGFIKVVKTLPPEIATKELVQVDCSKRKGQFDYVESVLPSLLKHKYTL